MYQNKIIVKFNGPKIILFFFMCARVKWVGSIYFDNFKNLW